MAAEARRREPRVASLLVSVTFHALAGFGVAVSSWWWGTPTLEAWKTHTVSLVDAPLSLQQSAVPTPTVPRKPSSASQPASQTPESSTSLTTPKANVNSSEPSKAPTVPKAKAKASEPSKAPTAPKAKAKASEPSKAPTAPKAKAKASEPSRKPEAAASVPAPKAKSPSSPAESASAEPTPTSQAASSREARSAIEALRQRQVKRVEERRLAETTRQVAASARIAALRDQLAQQEAVGGTAVTAAGVQHVRLMAYQDRVRAKIIETWILPLSAEQRRDLQATAQFQVMRSGHVVQLELVNPSGNPIFDTSLLRAIRRASPLPTLPDDYPLDVLEVEMRFRADS